MRETIIVCRYERIGAYVQGHCDEFELSSEKRLDRGQCESDMVRLVLDAIGSQTGRRPNPDEVCFVHAATAEVASA